MKVYPLDISYNDLSLNTIIESRSNLMRCVYINQITGDRIYVDGYFVRIYNSDDGYLVIDYIGNHNYPIGVPSMDSHCYVVYKEKKYYDMSELYRVFENDRLSKEIDNALK